MRAELLASLLVLLLPAACIAPSVVASSDRAVVAHGLELEWHDASVEDCRGLFESTSIEGAAADALWKVYYHFAASGRYSGAALVVGDGDPAFQTLEGAWSLADGRLDLDGVVSRAFAAPGFLRLEAEGGTVVLRAVPR